MAQEEKELLLKDLCSRLPYGVMCQVDDGVALRPMSSMTEEEKKELNSVLEFQYYSDDSCMCESTDWLNANHFDFHNLIERGLAIEVTEENNPYKE